jgi:hypothetical protein
LAVRLLRFVWRPELRATHFGFAILRIVYHATVLWLASDLWAWRASAFANHRREGAALLLIAFVVNTLLVVGFLTRPLLIVNAVLLRVLFFFCQDPYTVDDVVQHFSFVLAFAPEPRALSVDSARRGEHAYDAPLPFGFVLFVYTCLVLLYEDSVYFKLLSRVWRTGSAFWLGTALPFMSWTGGLPAWTEHVWLMKALTWGALAYEASFPLIVFAALRRPLLLIGLAVHIGSGIFFPLPQFGLVMIALLCLFVRFQDVRRREAVPSVVASPPPWTAGYLGYAVIGLTVTSQLWLHAAPGPNALSRVIGTQQWQIFVDWHFTLPAPLYRFALQAPGGDLPVPSFDAEGRPTTRDRYWKCLGFSLRNMNDPSPMISRYMRGWLEKERLASAPVRIECKDVRLPTLDIDFRLPDEIRARPWRKCAEMRFETISR